MLWKTEGRANILVRHISLLAWGASFTVAFGGLSLHPCGGNKKKTVLPRADCICFSELRHAHKLSTLLALLSTRGICLRWTLPQCGMELIKSQTQSQEWGRFIHHTSITLPITVVLNTYCSMNWQNVKSQTIHILWKQVLQMKFCFFTLFVDTTR